MPPERLQKILSRAGIASRRGAEQVMGEGRVTVNGKTVGFGGLSPETGKREGAAE